MMSKLLMKQVTSAVTSSDMQMLCTEIGCDASQPALVTLGAAAFTSLTLRSTTAGPANQRYLFLKINFYSYNSNFLV